MNGNSRPWLIVLIVALCFLGGGVFFFFGTLLRLVGPIQETGNVAIIEVTGTILDPTDTVELLVEARKDHSVKAVVLRVDSPGGSVSGSQEIFEEVRRLKVEKPVVASMGTVAASGGYYIAAPASKILASLGTITGSIGVRMEYVNIQDLLQWARLKTVTLKSGEMKDIASPTREMTPEEQSYLEGLLQAMHQQFKKAVSESRGISLPDLEAIADGRVLTGEEALKFKLIDDIGGLESAIKVAGELAKLSGEPEVYYLKKRQSPLEALTESVTENLFNRAAGIWSVPVRFSY